MRDEKMKSEQEIIIEMGNKIIQMEQKGLQDTIEYAKIVDDWETLSQNFIEGHTLYDAAQWEDVQNR